VQIWTRTGANAEDRASLPQLFPIFVSRIVCIAVSNICIYLCDARSYGCPREEIHALSPTVASTFPS
jgi:hypothetical protein